MDKYLLEILKESNTIIIPGLGALTITNSETGEIMFMPYLQHDDGKLAAFIAKKDGIEEVDAKNMVAKYVREIKSELDKGETYSMFRLGEFVKADDGDIEFTFWSDLNGNKEEEVFTPVASPIEEPIIKEPLTEVVETSEALTEGSEPDLETTESEETVEKIPPVTVNIPVESLEIESTEQEQEIKRTIEETLESTPEVEETIENNEPEIIPPVVETPNISNESEIELTQEEEEIKQVISEAFDVATEPEETPPVEPVAPLVESSYESTNYKDSYPKEPTFDSSTDPEATAAGMTGEEMQDSSEIVEKKEKEKAGVGFWITLIIIALLIIAGGAYVGRNYHEIKQHIPFLADKKEESTSKKSLKEEMSEAINEDKEKYSGSSSDSPEEDDSNVEEDTENTSEEESEEGTPVVEPEVVEQPIVEQPPVSIPSVSSSSSGPYKVIAGAFSSEANANRLAAEYKAKGLKSEVFLKGELHAVSIQSYATSEEANSNLAKLQSMAPGAWIYYKR